MALHSERRRPSIAGLDTLGDDFRPSVNARSAPGVVAVENSPNMVATTSYRLCRGRAQQMPPKSGMARALLKAMPGSDELDRDTGIGDYGALEKEEIP
jgi:hypothetical protein